MWKITFDAIAAVFFLAALAGSAEAHAHLKASTPPADAAVSAPVAEIRLQFNEAVEAPLSQISVEEKAGGPVAGAPVAGDPGDKAVLVLKLAQPLKPGSYKVNWRAVSADTHKIKGSFTFEVKP